jgi:S1-C subfamily serine protease
MTDDPTQRHDLPTEPAVPTWPNAAVPPATADGGFPTVEPITPASATPAASVAGGGFAPVPEARPEWTRAVDGAVPPTPERWYEPAPAVPVAAASTTTGQRSRTGIGTLLAVSLLSAVLAAGGTVLALGATGNLDRTTAIVPTTGQGSNAGAVKPVTLDESSATIDVAAKVSPAVVRITVSGTSSGDTGVIPATGVGSGVIYDSNGWILTNHHVVEGSDSLQVELKDGRTFTGTVYGIDTLTDLAIVKVDATGLPTAALGNSDALKVGQLVVAIGSPLGTYSNSVTSGIVSAKGRSISTDETTTLNNLIQTDAAINPGNSGGPLLDADGAIVGINTAIATDSNGIGFAIPIDIARPIMLQAVAGEPLSRPYLGIKFISIDKSLAAAQKLDAEQGALVGGLDSQGNIVPGVNEGTPAAAAGIQDGDIIVSVDGKVIDEEHPLDATLSQFAPDQTVPVEVLRDGATITLQVTLATRPPGL